MHFRAIGHTPLCFDAIGRCGGSFFKLARNGCCSANCKLGSAPVSLQCGSTKEYYASVPTPVDWRQGDLHLPFTVQLSNACFPCTSLEENQDRVSGMHLLQLPPLYGNHRKRPKLVKRLLPRTLILPKLLVLLFFYSLLAPRFLSNSYCYFFSAFATSIALFLADFSSIMLIQLSLVRMMDLLQYISSFTLLCILLKVTFP